LLFGGKVEKGKIDVNPNLQLVGGGQGEQQMRVRLLMMQAGLSSGALASSRASLRFVEKEWLLNDG